MGTQTRMINMLEAGLNASTLRSKVIANNIANMNTPGFRRSTVQFEQIIARALESADPKAFAQATPLITKALTTPLNASGNDVDLDMEVGELIKNSATHKVYMRLMAKMYRQVEMAIGLG